MKLNKLRIFLAFLLFIFSNSFVSTETDKGCEILNCFTFKKKDGIKFPNNIYILIDPGHGGDCFRTGTDNRHEIDKGKIINRSESHDYPTTNSRFNEKDIVLEYAKKLKNLLNEWGYSNVKLTRTDDNRQEPWEKAQISYEYFFDKYFSEYKKVCDNNSCCDPFIPIFISLHNNGWFPPKDQYGAFQLYCFNNPLPDSIQSWIKIILPTNKTDETEKNCMWVFTGRKFSKADLQKKRI